MEVNLYLNTANDYALSIGAPVYHPHVSIVHYDEAGPIHHTLNRYNVYGLFLQDEFPENLQYGIGTYRHAHGSMLAVAPGQIGGKTNDGTLRQYHGWALLFDTEFVQHTLSPKRMAQYHYFSYNVNEALFLTDDEKALLAGLMSNIRIELAQSVHDAQTESIVKDYIQLILDYCNRFYTRQFQEITATSNDLLSRFQQVLRQYYEQQLQYQQGLPSVKYCASQLCLSAGYFGDLIRQAIGQSPKDYIKAYVVTQGKSLLLGGRTVTQVANDLGFEYAPHFTRFFKAETGQTPSQFLSENQKK